MGAGEPYLLMDAAACRKRAPDQSDQAVELKAGLAIRRGNAYALVPALLTAGVEVHGGESCVRDARVRIVSRCNESETRVLLIGRDLLNEAGTIESMGCFRD